MISMKTVKVVLIKEEFYPFVYVQEIDKPWVIDPKHDNRNKVVEIPEVLLQDYEATLELLNGLRDRLMKYYAK